MSRLSVLESSLVKKQAALDAAIADHFDTVKAANGQPLNDKRNGARTLARWEKQNDKIRKLQEEIEKTKAAIEKENYKINNCAETNTTLPTPLLAAMQAGEITQWRRHPNRFFVPGVDKARIVWHEGTGTLAHSYDAGLRGEQRQLFASVFNRLKAEINTTEPATPEPEPEPEPAAAMSISRIRIQFARWHYHRHSTIAMSPTPAAAAFTSNHAGSSTHLDEFGNVVTQSSYNDVIDGQSLNLRLVSTTRNGITITIADDAIVALSRCTRDCRLILSHPAANAAIPCPTDSHVYPATREIKGAELRILSKMPKPAHKGDSIPIDHRHVSYNFHACLQAAIKTKRNIAVRVDSERLTITAGTLKYRLPWCAPVITVAKDKPKKVRLTAKQKIAIEIAALMDQDEDDQPITS